MKILSRQEATTCQLVDGYRRFGGASFFRSVGNAVQHNPDFLTPLAYISVQLKLYELSAPFSYDVHHFD